MTDVTEHGLEYMFYGILFCIATMMLLWLHGNFIQLLQAVGTTPEQTIMFEKKG